MASQKGVGNDQMVKIKENPLKLTSEFRLSSPTADRLT